ncbi:MAG: hypothetical protein JO166_21365 [Deltaproteobacteria bacterium]|nr:hypothetical protein [Deltaproteobacteria bacterium]
MNQGYDRFTQRTNLSSPNENQNDQWQRYFCYPRHEQFAPQLDNRSGSAGKQLALTFSGTAASPDAASMPRLPNVGVVRIYSPDDGFRSPIGIRISPARYARYDIRAIASVILDYTAVAAVIGLFALVRWSGITFGRTLDLLLVVVVVVVVALSVVAWFAGSRFDLRLTRALLEHTDSGR